jgi:hypothetical protein
MSSLIGPGHISDFLGRSEREFEKSKRGYPTPRACQQAESAAASRSHRKASSGGFGTGLGKR